MAWQAVVQLGIVPNFLLPSPIQVIYALVTDMLDVPSVIAGVPCRYIHAGTAICALDDVEEAASVAVATIERLDATVLAGF